MVYALLELVLTIILPILSLIFVVLRSVARFSITRQAGIDDYVIIAAWVCSVAFSVGFVTALCFGGGHRKTELSKSAAISVLKSYYTLAFSYGISLSLTKIAILMQYLRLVVVPAHKKLCWVLVTYNALYIVATVLFFIVTCRPIAYFWDKSIPNGTCEGNYVSWYANAACDIFSDITLVLFPVLLLKDLHLPRRQKYALIIIFALGGCGCIAAIFRLHALFLAAKSDDFIKDAVSMLMWSSVEANVSITCACLPTVRPVLIKIFPKAMASISRQQSVPTQELPRHQLRLFQKSLDQPSKQDSFHKIVSTIKQKPPEIKERPKTWIDFQPHKQGYQWSISGPATAATVGGSKALW